MLVLYVSSEGIPPRESALAKVACEGPILLTGSFMPSRSLEVPNDLVVPPEGLTTRLADLRCTPALACVLRRLPAGSDEGHAPVTPVRVNENRVPLDVADHAFFVLLRSLGRRKGVANMLWCRGLDGRGGTRSGVDVVGEGGGRWKVDRQGGG